MFIPQTPSAKQDYPDRYNIVQGTYCAQIGYYAPPMKGMVTLYYYLIGCKMF